jgi:hypothetical protein
MMAFLLSSIQSMCICRLAKEYPELADLVRRIERRLNAELPAR